MGNSGGKHQGNEHGRNVRLFLMLSIAAPFYYGVITLHHAFSHPFMVQDDMRQHVVWFYQFMDSSLFQGNGLQVDIIANYFRSVAPWGVTAIYWLGAKAGLAPLVLAKLLPLPLALIATGFLFFTTLELIPVPLAAWLATLIFNQHLWLNDDLVTATPRAFVYPLFAAFLYFLARLDTRKSNNHRATSWAMLGMLAGAMLGAIALLGLFFPQMMLVAVAMLGVRLVQGQWQNGQWRNGRLRLRLTTQRRPWGYALLGLCVAAMVVVPFALNLSDYGSAITVTEMRSQLEYQAQGRNPYFGVHPISFLLHGSSGLRIPVFPSIIWAGFALPFLMCGPKDKGAKLPLLGKAAMHTQSIESSASDCITPSNSPLLRGRTGTSPHGFRVGEASRREACPKDVGGLRGGLQKLQYLRSSVVIQAITPKIRLLWDLTIASFCLYVAAHVLLLRLHFPSRYLYHSWRFSLAIASGIVLAALIEKGWQWWQRSHPSLSRTLKRLIIIPLILVPFLVPLWPPLVFTFQGWVPGDISEVYAYLAEQPADTLVASLAPEGNNIPAFARRSTWTGREFSLPHHPQYYTEVRQRTADLLQAQYSPDLEDIQQLVNRTGIDFLLVETSAFEADYLDQDWLLHSSLQPQVQEIMAQMENGVESAMTSYLPTCAVVSTEHYRLINGDCLLAKSNSLM